MNIIYQGGLVIIEIIETNLSGPINEKSIQIIDHQSRVIKADSWEEYISFYSKPEDKELRNKFPRTLPRQIKVLDFKHDNFHLSCIIDAGTFQTYKLAYIKGECF